MPARLISEQFPDGDPTFKIRPPIKIARLGDVPAEVDLVVDFDERVTCAVDDVILQVVS